MSILLPVIDVEGVDYATFQLLLEYLYTDNVKKDQSKEQLQTLWTLADKYTLENLKCKCNV